jgi:hypothetical protein
MWFYDSLLQQFAQDVALFASTSFAAGPLPKHWMPESMHCCLTRLEINILHNPTSLQTHWALLQEQYGQVRDHFYGYAKTHATTLKDAFQFLSAKDIQSAFKTLQYELKLYSLYRGSIYNSWNICCG